jgi:hypothetical protein
MNFFTCLGDLATTTIAFESGRRKSFWLSQPILGSERDLHEDQLCKSHSLFLTLAIFFAATEPPRP